MTFGHSNSSRGDARVQIARGWAFPLVPDVRHIPFSQLNDSQSLARDIFKELIEINYGRGTSDIKDATPAPLYSPSRIAWTMKS